MSEFQMPSLGADMDRGRIVEWMVGPGERVQRGQVVVLVETEKGIIEVEIWEDGVVGEILVAAGEEVPVGTPIATVGAAATTPAPEVPKPEPLPEPEPESEPQRQPEPALAGAGAAPAPTPPVRHLAHELHVDLAGLSGTGPEGAITRDDIRAAAAGTAPASTRVRSSPRARALAAAAGVELADLTGTGPGGAVTEADVRAATPTAPPAPPVGETTPTAPPASPEADAEARRRAAMRHAIGQVMARSKREIPHYYLGTTVDMTRALTWLEERNADRPVTERVLPAVLMLKAAAAAVRSVPEMNGFWVDDQFQQSEAVHLGVAVSLRTGGLIAPAIHNADTLSLAELMAALQDLVQRARSGRLRGSEMSDPTITATNLGERGVEEVYGVIYAPQVALVGFGKVVERPWAEDGMVGARRVVRATLAADHRVSDGHRGGLYLAAIDRRLQEPESL